MEIAILGTGHIGSTLGRKWADAGHTIHFGSRNPQKPAVQALLNALGGTATASTIGEAIDQGEVVVFAVPGEAMDATIADHGKALEGKIIVDTANIFGTPVMNSFAAFTRHAPTSRYFRAFNIYGWENFENPTYSHGAADLFYCGADGEPRALVEGLITNIGLQPVYVGGADQSDVVDGILKLWFALSAGQKQGRHLAFQVVR